MDYNNLSTEELEKNFNPRESVENFSHYLEDSLLKSKDVKKQTHIYENIEYGNRLIPFSRTVSGLIRPTYVGSAPADLSC